METSEVDMETKLSWPYWRSSSPFPPMFVPWTAPPGMFDYPSRFCYSSCMPPYESLYPSWVLPWSYPKHSD